MCDIAERNGFHGIEYIEVREVRDVRQTNDGDVQSSTLLFSVLCQTLCQAVLLIQIDGRIRQNTEDRDSGQVLQHAQTALQNGHISTEFVDDNALDSPALLRFQQGNCAIQRGKYATTVDIAHQNYRRVGEVCHAHVDNIHGFQIDFRRTAGALQHNDVIFCSQRIIGTDDLGDHLLFSPVVFRGTHGVQHLAVDNDL